MKRIRCTIKEAKKRGEHLLSSGSMEVRGHTNKRQHGEEKGVLSRGNQEMKEWHNQATGKEEILPPNKEIVPPNKEATWRREGYTTKRQPRGNSVWHKEATQSGECCGINRQHEEERWCHYEAI